MSTKKVFEDIFISRKWGGPKGESVSGRGSSIRTTDQLRSDLVELIKELEIKTFADGPCGDGNWISLIDWDATEVSYIGLDIVPEVVAKAKERMPSGQFEVCDITSSHLPTADIILVRDCLVHLSNSLIWKVIENIKRSGIKYILTTTFVNRKENKDITTGKWRTLNMEIAPFFLPKPIKYLQDFYPFPEYADKRLGLWLVKDL